MFYQMTRTASCVPRTLIYCVRCVRRGGAFFVTLVRGLATGSLRLQPCAVRATRVV